MEKTMRKFAISKTIKAVVLAIALFVGVSSQAACGKDKVEKSIAVFVRGVKAAREVTTEQYEYKYISADEYRARLELFKKVYISTDKLGDKLVEFGEINSSNKIEVLGYVQEVNNAVKELINSGNLGVKNETTRRKFNTALLTASATLSSIQVVVAAIEKPVATGDIKIDPAPANQ